MKKKNVQKKRIFISTFNRVESLASGKENVWFPDSPYSENLLNFRTGRDVWYSPTQSNIGVIIQLHKGDGPVVEEESIVLVSRCCKYDFFPRF